MSLCIQRTPQQKIQKQTINRKNNSVRHIVSVHKKEILMRYDARSYVEK